jgi:hypothetical protein
MALMQGHADLIDSLLAMGADIEARANDVLHCHSTLPHPTQSHTHPPTSGGLTARWCTVNGNPSNVLDHTATSRPGHTHDLVHVRLRGWVRVSGGALPAFLPPTSDVVQGMTPLHVAAGSNPPKVEILVAKGANVKATFGVRAPCPPLSASPLDACTHARAAGTQCVGVGVGPCRKPGSHGRCGRRGGEATSCESFREGVCEAEPSTKHARLWARLGADRSPHVPRAPTRRPIARWLHILYVLATPPSYHHRPLPGTFQLPKTKNVRYPALLPASHSGTAAHSTIACCAITGSVWTPLPCTTQAQTPPSFFGQPPPHLINIAHAHAACPPLRHLRYTTGAAITPPAKSFHLPPVVLLPRLEF